MSRVLLVAVVVLYIAQAAAAADSQRSTLDADALVSGDALAGRFAAASAAAVPSPEEVVALDAEMRAFIAPIAAIRDARRKLTALLAAMEARGLFSMDYVDTTRTVSATFYGRQGNCLSATMLFVTLARAVGLSTFYQSVEVPPSWVDDGRVVVANHVNALLRTGVNETTVIDFNVSDYEGKQTSRRISDANAFALFYTNVGAEALLREDYATSFEYFRAAASQFPDIAGTWVNLGVLYARHGLDEHAEAAYLKALEVDAAEDSALTNLAFVYAERGEHERAQVYQRRVQHYRERNPYYHFQSAGHAFDEQRWQDALGSLRRALRLKRDEHQFYALQARVLEALGRGSDAAKSLAEARKYGAAEQRRKQASALFDALALR